MMRIPHDDKVNGLSRRSFLKTAATATGGLVIAVYLPACSKPEEAAKNAGPAKLVDANAAGTRPGGTATPPRHRPRGGPARRRPPGGPPPHRPRGRRR